MTQNPFKFFSIRMFLKIIKVRRQLMKHKAKSNVSMAL